VLLVFHGFGGRLAVMDVGPTMMNQIMHYCFKEIHLRRRDLNGKNQFGQWIKSIHCSLRTSPSLRNICNSCRNTTDLYIFSLLIIAVVILFDSMTCGKCQVSQGQDLRSYVNVE